MVRLAAGRRGGRHNRVMPALTPQERERLEALERSLWKAATRFDREHMERVLAADFREFGRSGRTYTRADILAFKPSELDAVLRDLEIRALGPNVALVTYRSELLSDGDPALAHRSSIWTLLDGN